MQLCNITSPSPDIKAIIYYKHTVEYVWTSIIEHFVKIEVPYTPKTIVQE